MNNSNFWLWLLNPVEDKHGGRTGDIYFIIPPCLSPPQSLEYQAP